MKHLRYNLYGASLAGENSHAQKIMRDLGIKYQHATPQSIADQWWFWNCENIPENLPPYITELNVTPSDAIGYGLSKEKAQEIEDYKPC